MKMDLQETRCLLVCGGDLCGAEYVALVDPESRVIKCWVP